MGSRRFRAVAVALAASLLWSFESQGAPPSLFPELPELEPDDATVAAVWYDGGERLVLATKRAAWSLRHGEDARQFVHELEVVDDVDGTSGRGGVSVVVSRAGKALRARGGQWELGRAPLVEGDELVAVAVDAQGRAHCVGREKAVYLWEGQRWRTVPYPPGPTRMIAASVSAGGELFVVGQHGHLLRLSGGSFDRVIVPGLPAEVNEADWNAVWYGGLTRTLWVRAGVDHLVEIDLETRRGESHRIPIADARAAALASELSAIDGVGARDGDTVVFNVGQTIHRFDRSGFHHLSSETSPVHDVALVTREDAVYVATRDGLRRRSALADPSGEEDVDELADHEQRQLDRERRYSERWSAISQTTKGFYMPVARLAPGVSFPLEADPSAAFMLEVGAGVILTPKEPPEPAPVLWMWPEAAYRWSGHDSRGGHAVDIGLGFGFGTHIAAGFYKPRLAIAGLGDAAGTYFGYRHGLSVQILWGTIGLEFAHQLTGSNSGPQNELALTLGINFAPLVWLAVIWGTTQGAERKRGRGQPRARAR